MAETIYGLALILFIIFLPAGLYGGIRELLIRRTGDRAIGRFDGRRAQESVD